MYEKTCCFLGHRNITETDALKKQLADTIERLISEEKVDCFLFGSKSRFDSLCLELVTGIKEKHPHIRRVYVRAEFPLINEEYKEYLLELYDDTFYPEKLLGAGRSVYVERNREMINKSRFCIFYCDKSNAPVERISGTRLALEYAIKCERIIVLFPT